MRKAIPCLALVALALVGWPPPGSPTQSLALTPMAESSLTHGPMLGEVTATSIRVWVRTRRPMPFRVRTREGEDLSGARTFPAGQTTLEHDNTGWLQLAGLKPDTKYAYAVEVDGRLVDTKVSGRLNSFRTLPDAERFRHPQRNPKGLFNFRFEVGSCSNQNPANGNPPDPPAYGTMLRELKDRVAFQIMDGDWLYEEVRDTTPAQWARATDVPRVPPLLDLAPGIAGVWENYKLYLSRSPNLANFHREIPFFITFDDHEILNDVYGCGEIGLRTDARRPEAQGLPGRGTPEGVVERAVFRDPALRAWEDYLGWANPDVGLDQPIRFGRARFTTGSDVLTDPDGDFRSLNLDKAASLHVLWGAGNTGVYEIIRVLDRNRLQIRPAPDVTEAARYSIGTNHYSRFRVSNCDFYLLDTRSFRTMHNVENPRDPKTSMLGARQREWLVREMRRSDADFFFVVSSVNFTIPHVNTRMGAEQNKDDAWTAHLAEREQLFRLFESLGRPVFLLTGDLHNCFAVRVTDRIWEFASGPHNSNNHWRSDAGATPPTGWFDSGGRRVRVRWSTGYLNDVPKNELHYPNYCVVQVNNVENAPDREGHPRWSAYPEPQVVFSYYDGLTAQLKYAESVALERAAEK